MEPESPRKPKAAEPAGGGAAAKSKPVATKKGGPLSGGVGLFLIVLLLGTAAYMAYQTFTTPTAEPVSTVFMCIETGKTFDYAMKQGEQYPVLSPLSGKRTGFPTETCYWTADGKHKESPTYIVLNEHRGKSGDTICPDCGRVVIGHNPPPPPEVPLAPTSKADAPPTQPGG